MNLIETFGSFYNKQKKLDARINEGNDFSQVDMINTKLIALRVETFELLNELPEEFKFWSHKKNNMEKAFFELIDILHFILSIGNEISILDYEENIDVKPARKANDLYTMIESLDAEVISLKSSHLFFKGRNREEIYLSVLAKFIALVDMLGFSWDDIKKGYDKKNEINYERQDNGY